MLINHLPIDRSAFMRAVAPDAAEMSLWGPAEHIAANLFDITAKAHFKNPSPYPRPAEVVEQRQRAEARASALADQQQRIKTRMEATE